MKTKMEIVLKDKLNIGNKIPLRKWSNDWQLPSECKIEKYKTNLKIKGKKIKIERLRSLGRMEDAKNMSGKRWYKGSSTRGLDYIIEKDQAWCILKSKFPPNITVSASDLSREGEWLYLQIPEDKLGVWYADRFDRINFCIVPKEIELTEDFWEVFGILQGEMTQKSIDIKVSNTEPLIINLLLEFFDKNKLISKNDWRITVSINSRNIPQEKRTEFSRKIRNYWSTKLNIPSEKIINIFWYDQFNSTLNPNYGEINLQFENSCLREVIDIFLEFVKKEVLKNKEYATSFLRGLFAAEGSVDPDKNGRLLEIRLSAKELKERQLYKKICDIVGLKATCEIKHHHVRIHNLINFLKCLEYDIFKLHEERKKKFILHLKNFITVQALYLIFKSPKTVRELVELLKLNDYRNLNKNLSRLTKESILHRTKIKRCYVYQPTSKLTSLLHLIS